MTLTPETILNAQKTHLETLFGLTQKAFDGVEKLVELNVSASRAALSDAANHSQQLLSVKDAQQLLALQAQWFQPLAEKTAAYSRSLYDIANGTGSAIAQTVEARAAEAQKNLTDLIDSATKNAPPGTEAAVAVLKNSFSAANNAAESVQKAVKQASDLAQANLQTASKNVADAVKSSTQQG
ncbi:phasin family protein [Pantoea sp. 18069]|uniref:phasin family protein n=1 Tax=Pantoea sp. 18069 TaxID=2681415 RepID=UPI0013575AC3|nr:phasin family protein [Pantoea sp. 18069]